MFFFLPFVFFVYSCLLFCSRKRWSDILSLRREERGFRVYFSPLVSSICTLFLPVTNSESLCRPESFVSLSFFCFRRAVVVLHVEVCGLPTVRARAEGKDARLRSGDRAGAFIHSPPLFLELAPVCTLRGFSSLLLTTRPDRIFSGVPLFAYCCSAFSSCGVCVESLRSSVPSQLVCVCGGSVNRRSAFTRT